MKRRRFAKQKPATIPGLTHADCATGCTAAKCAISGKPYCGHPRKGGLRFADMGNAAAAARMAIAEAQLSPAKVGALLKN